MDIIYNNPWLLSKSVAIEYLQTYETYHKTRDEKQEIININDSWEPRIIDDVAIIPVTGIIMRYANNLNSICGTPTSTGLLYQAIKNNVANDDISCIILEIDSPGGDARGISALAQYIRTATETKPVIAYATGQCASAAYWIASACSKIYASDTALIGSIGAVACFHKDKDKNVEEIVSSQSPNKRLNIDEVNDRTIIQQTIDDMADVFISAVGNYRNMSKEEVVEAGNHGAVLIASKALNNKLIDGIINMDTIISEQHKENIMSKKEEEQIKLTTDDVTALKGSIPDEVYDKLLTTLEITSSQNELIAKQQAELLTKNQELETKQAELTKQYFMAKAEKEYPNLTGTIEEKGKVLMQIANMDNDIQSYLLGLMKSVNNGLAEMMQPITIPETQTETSNEYETRFQKELDILMKQGNMSYTEAKCKAHMNLGKLKEV